jgi:hypothetical protein
MKFLNHNSTLNQGRTQASDTTHEAAPSFQANVNSLLIVRRVSPDALPCASCGSTSRRLGAGKVPGGASLRCSCNKFIKWLTPGEVAKLEARLGGQR